MDAWTGRRIIPILAAFSRSGNMRIILVTACLLVTVLAPAMAQPWFGDNDAAKQTTITVNFQIRQPVPDSASPSDDTALIQAAQQQLFDLINHECDVLKQALKSDCSMKNVNTNGSSPNRIYNNAMVINASASATFLIGPVKPPRH
jgi:hypothetical protein